MPEIRNHSEDLFSTMRQSFWTGRRELPRNVFHGILLEDADVAERLIDNPLRLLRRNLPVGLQTAIEANLRSKMKRIQNSHGISDAAMARVYERIEESK